MDFDRVNFVRILKWYFPQAVFVWNLESCSWTDTVDLTCIQLRIRTWTKTGIEKTGIEMTAGDVMVEILGMGDSGTHVTLWKRRGFGRRGLQECLQALKEKLQGLACGFLTITEEPLPEMDHDDVIQAMTLAAAVPRVPVPVPDPSTDPDPLSVRDFLAGLGF